MTTQEEPHVIHYKGITNEEFAQLFLSKPQSVTWRVSKFGHYYGLKPIKLPNRRLMWNRNDALELLKKHGALV